MYGLSLLQELYLPGSKLAGLAFLKCADSKRINADSFEFTHLLWNPVFHG